MLFHWASDHGLLVTFDGRARDDVRGRVHGALDAVRRGAIPGLLDAIPGAASLLLVCDLRNADPGAFEQAARAALADAPRAAPSVRLVTVPVCYDAPHAPDLEDVARQAGLSSAEVIARHAAATYVVAFLGFQPGFPYLDGLPAELATPRLSSPRRGVAKGSVAIGGAFCGIYPAPTPGGWRIVGRTPLTLFDPARSPMAALLPGDRVRFVPVSPESFAEPA